MTIDCTMHDYDCTMLDSDCTMYDYDCTMHDSQMIYLRLLHSKYYDIIDDVIDVSMISHGLTFPFMPNMDICAIPMA